MAESPAPRKAASLRPRLDYRRGYRRLLYSHLAWPMLAVLSLGGLGTLLMPTELTGAWAVLVTLMLVGAFLPLSLAVMLGGATFITAAPFLLMQQSGGRLDGGVFLLMALLAFAPTWLAVARAQQARAVHLHMLLSLPQVRSAIDVSDWSLLPRPRALDRRLQEVEKAGEATPAIVLRIAFSRLAESREVLGELQLQQSILVLADDLRILLRTGDLIVDDIRSQGALYVLAFHNPEATDSLGAILRRLAPTLRSTGLEYSLSYALYPDSGSRLYAMRWSPVELP